MGLPPMSLTLVVLDAKSLGSCPGCGADQPGDRRAMIVIDPDALGRLTPVGGRVGAGP